MTHAPALIVLLAVICALLSGYPVAAVLVAVSFAAAIGGALLGVFDAALLQALPSRVFGVITNPVLIAVPLFVFMGLVLEKSGLADTMFRAAAHLLRRRRGGLLAAVSLTGVLLAASTGIVGASVVTLGLLALPQLLARGVPASLAAGSVAACGTLGQIIPPSIVLIVLGDQMSNAWQKAQVDAGRFAPEAITVSDLFAGALVPGLLLAMSFAGYQMWRGRKLDDPVPSEDTAIGGPIVLFGLIAPLLLVIGVLGSIVAGVATPTEAASIGAVGALLLAFLKGGAESDRIAFIRPALEESVYLTSMIFFIVIGASVFSLVFRGFGGNALVEAALGALPGGLWGMLCGVMLLIFLLGFFLEFLEITYLVVPLVAPALLTLMLDTGEPLAPVWLGVLIALNLQTSFLTPPFGVSLFYLRSVAPDTVTMMMIYRGVAPFIALQLLVLLLIVAFPPLATFLPAFFDAG